MKRIDKRSGVEYVDMLCRRWQESRQGKFESAMLSTDALLSHDKNVCLGDSGACAEKMYSALDGDCVNDALDEPELNGNQQEKLLEAKQKLVSMRLKRLIPILMQIVANGRHRGDSIVNLCRIWNSNINSATIRYYRGRSLLLKAFSPSRIKGETHIEK
jgi:hypothetical protein